LTSARSPKDQAIAMGLPGVDYYGVAMYLEVDGEQVDLSADNLESVVRTDPAGGTNRAHSFRGTTSTSLSMTAGVVQANTPCSTP
jgi:hypothetical protein